jgi:predicted ribosome quality control (RQC) complex YloA/Tae2 family protein
MGKYREYKLSSGMKILLGKNAENNDELVKEFKGSKKIILHTVKPGSPFCVINSESEESPNNEEIHESGIICALRSQDWRDNHSDVELHQFTGKDVKKPLFAKAGSWKLKGNPKVIKIKKKEIELWEKKLVKKN